MTPDFAQRVAGLTGIALVSVFALGFFIGVGVSLAFAA